MDLYVLVFVAVSVGIGAGYFLLVDLLSQDASLVRRRMENDLDRDIRGLAKIVGHQHLPGPLSVEIPVCI